MRCPFCNSSNDSVLDSRQIDSASVIRRRRVCKGCQKRFTTYERLEEMPLMVVKSDDRREPFDRNKLREGILRACEKRPVSVDRIDRLVAEVEYELKDYVMEIPSRVIGEKVLKKLHVIDQVAYVRFASVYRNFSDIDSFLVEIHKLKSKRTRTRSSQRAALSVLSPAIGAEKNTAGKNAVPVNGWLKTKVQK